MTPTEKDKELSEKLRVMIRGYLRNYTDIARDSSVYANEVLSLITADRERVALEARLDELRLASDMQYMMRREDRVNYCSKRIVELKAQQEEVK